MLVSIILLITGFLSGWISAQRQSDRLIASMREHSSVMVRHFAENCARILILQDFAELEAFLLKSAELPEVMQLLVFEPDGRVVGDITRRPDGTLISSSAILEVPLPSGQEPSVEIAGERLVFRYPIRAGNLLGWIRADFSLARIRQEQHNAWVQDLFLSLLWVVLSGSLILLMLRHTADALRNLASFARELHEHKGDTINVNHEAIEIKALEESLNYASQQLLSTEQERQAHLRYFENMDRVNRAIQGAITLEQMMGDVLDIIVAIFKCDRTGIVYPCDPDAPTWQVIMERSNDEYPSNIARDEMPMNSDRAASLQLVLNAHGRPVQFGPGGNHQVSQRGREGFDIKSFIAMAVFPKVGKPWELAVLQCSYERVWTPEEERMFLEIGRRLGDALTSLLTYRNLQERESDLRRLNERLDQRVQDRTTELEAKNTELERLNKIFVGRELRMIELKERIRKLEESKGISP